MGKYTQANRLLAVTTPLGKDALLLERFVGTEAISELYHFRLELLAERGTAVPFDQLLGQKIAVELRPPRGTVRQIHGIVSRLTQGPQVRSAQGDVTFVRYRMEVVPRLWLWTKTVQSRIFQHISVADILKELLAGLKPDLSFELTGTYQPRNYCVQYRESDFAFVSRLMEEEGIYYFFKHTADGCQMVVADSSLAHPDLPEPTKIIYEEIE